MKAVMSSVPPEILEWRKRTGADRWDEMWDGVLHMTPSPNREHQDLLASLLHYLREHWPRPRKAKVYPNLNLSPPGGWNRNYRIPDLLLVSPERFDMDRNEYFEGPPDVVVEIRSPGDESREKLAFYEELGVPEVWLIDRDSKTPEIHVLADGRLRKETPGSGGWLRSERTALEMRVGEPGKLAIRVSGDASTRADLPD